MSVQVVVNLGPIDWGMLARQKRMLEGLRQDRELVDGLLQLIDAIQDSAHRNGHPVYRHEDAGKGDDN